MQNNKDEKKKIDMIKNIAIVIGVIGVFVILSSVLQAGPVSKGKAPDFKIPVANSAASNTSEILKLSDLKGKIVILDFWSTTCPPCLAQINVLKRIKRDYKAKKIEIVGLAVGGESLERIKIFAAQRQINYPTGPDSRGVAATTYKVSSLPTLFIINKKGNIVDSHIGYQPESTLVKKIKKYL